MRRNKGITLVEVIVTLAIIAIVIPLVYSVFFAGAKSYSFSTNKGFAQQDLRFTADILTKELRFATDVSDEGLNTREYYSLRIDDEGNLVKTKHLYQDDDTIVDTIITTIPGNWHSINIVNNNLGVINIELEQIEQSGYKEAGFDLTMAISTENSPSMLSNLSFELVNGDILYYQNTKIVSLSNDIYLSRPSSPEGDSVVVRFYTNYDSNPLYHTVNGKGGTITNLPSIPSRGGYTFSEWNTSSDGTGISYGSGGATTFNMPSNNSELYAIWVLNNVLAKVTIDNLAGTDGVVKIDSTINPKKNADGRFLVAKNSGSKVRIKLLGYTSLHDQNVTVIVNNSTIAIEDSGYISFTAKTDDNGSKKEFEVKVIIKTEGQSENFEKTYKFITS